MYFASRGDAKLWIIKNQLGRRNLSAYDRSVLALKLKPVIAEKAKEQQGARTDICQKSDRGSIDTKKELAKFADYNHKQLDTEFFQIALVQIPTKTKILEFKRYYWTTQKIRQINSTLVCLLQ